MICRTGAFVNGQRDAALPGAQLGDRALRHSDVPGLARWSEAFRCLGDVWRLG